jgi:4-hydroxy-3-methylbut-2-enyl diphosphate reductase IspH
MSAGPRAFRLPMKVKRAAKYGFCSGVRIADLKVKRFAAGGGRGAILGQVVHNERVVEEMEQLGVRTVHEIAAVAGADHRLLGARRPAIVS